MSIDCVRWYGEKYRTCYSPRAGGSRAGLSGPLLCMSMCVQCTCVRVCVCVSDPCVSEVCVVCVMCVRAYECGKR